MKTVNKGSGLIVGLTVLGIFAVLGLIAVTSLISANNSGVKQEAGLKNQYSNMEQVLGQYSLKVVEAAQVPTLQKEALKEVAIAALQGRYGENGSQATFQWIQEQNPNVDQSTYLKIQQIIEGGRDNFQNEQTKFLDMKRSYETDLGSFPSGIWLKLLGFPKKSLEDYKLISSEHAQETFATGVDKGITLTK